MTRFHSATANARSHVSRATRLVPLVSWLALAACSDTYTTTSYTDPDSFMETDDATVTGSLSFDPTLAYTGPNGANENHSTDAYRFDVAPFMDDAEKSAAQKLYPSHAAQLAANPGGIPSVQSIVTYVKQLDDTIYAGVEHAAETGGIPTLTAKRQLLADSLAWLVANPVAGAGDGAVALAAALELGGGSGDVPAALRSQVDASKSAFLADTFLSTPASFYTWSDELRGIWLQDRYLQQLLPSGSSCAVAQALAADPGRRAAYVELSQLYTRMTNPLLDSLAATLPSVAGGACADSVDHAFLSASETAEVELFAKLYPDGVPDGANLMADLITAIRSGTVDLTPTPDQGWYAWQEYALETLLVTDQAEERAKVAFTGTYKLRLVEAFETELTEHRETHEEQADEGEAEDTIAPPRPPPNPDFRLEPLATVYVRHARSYVFLEQALDTVLGAGALDQAFAVDASGVTTDTLRTRIRHARDLFFGSYLLACQDIGLRPSLAVAGDPDPSTYATLESQAVTWLQGFPSDPLAAADVRVITPISSLPDHRALYWAVVGVRTTLVAYSFLSGVTNEPVTDPTLTARVPLPTEQFVQVESSDTPLDRDDFRALCDANPTVDGITKALAAR